MILILWLWKIIVSALPLLEIETGCFRMSHGQSIIQKNPHQGMKTSMTLTQILIPIIRGKYRAAARSKMERFVIIVNSFQPLTIITKRSILVVAAALDPPLIIAM